MREQFFMLLLEPEASLAAIPKLLPPGEDERRAGLAVDSQRAVGECGNIRRGRQAASIA